MIDRICLVMELLSGLGMHQYRSATAREWLSLLHDLPARDARVVVLRVLHELSTPEIAERLGVSRGRVSQLWERAKLKLSRDCRVSALSAA